MILPEASTIRAVHVIAGLDAVHGGPSYTVPRLCRALAASGAEIDLLSVAAQNSAACEAAIDGYRHRCSTWNYATLPILRDMRYSSGFARALRAAAPNADLLHNHGLWLMPNVQAGRESARSQKPLIVAPRGMLAPAALAFSRRKKRVFWRLFQGAAVRRAACIHATSEQEFEEIRTFGLLNPVAVIPNGIDLPALPDFPVMAAEGDRSIVSLGRIHPIKGLERLMAAWARVEKTHPNWRLRVIGPSDSGYAAKLQDLARSLGIGRLSIEGPVYGDAKHAVLRAADLFVLPSLNESFAVTVGEALAAGTPVIVSKGVPWRGLETEGCGWWINHGIEPLAEALTKAMAMPPEALSAIGAKGRAWIARDFSWERIARDMLGVYRWLARGAEPPPTVRFG
jgi:glycosyltransferase involved in cell wall biosynthesis